MKPQAVIPPEFEQAADALALSPGVLSSGHLFLSGTTGSLPEGTMPKDPEAQMRSAWDKIGTVLQAGGLGFDAIVEMTSYHIGLQAHFDLFNRVRLDYLVAPYPAWTAVEVAGLRREGAIVEIRVIAQSGS